MFASFPGGVVIDVRVIPRASKSAIAGTRGEALLVGLKAPPVEGAANEELVEIIAETLGVSRRSVTIVSGQRDRDKRVKVDGISEQQARERLMPPRF